jgi:hypothetical protein
MRATSVVWLVELAVVVGHKLLAEEACSLAAADLHIGCVGLHNVFHVVQ